MSSCESTGRTRSGRMWRSAALSLSGGTSSGDPGVSCASGRRCAISDTRAQVICPPVTCQRIRDVRVHATAPPAPRHAPAPPGSGVRVGAGPGARAEGARCAAFRRCSACPCACRCAFKKEHIDYLHCFQKKIVRYLSPCAPRPHFALLVCRVPGLNVEAPAGVAGRSQNRDGSAPRTQTRRHQAARRVCLWLSVVPLPQQLPLSASLYAGAASSRGTIGARASRTHSSEGRESSPPQSQARSLASSTALFPVNGASCTAGAGLAMEWIEIGAPLAFLNACELLSNGLLPFCAGGRGWRGCLLRRESCGRRVCGGLRTIGRRRRRLLPC